MGESLRQDNVAKLQDGRRRRKDVGEGLSYDSSSNRTDGKVEMIVMREKMDDDIDIDIDSSKSRYKSVWYSRYY